ncbi:MAG: 3-keto-disaccharide hydrolase [Planctomycetota bacterium]
MRTALLAISVTLACLAVATSAAVAAPPGEGWIALFNGKDLAGWKVPEGDGGHWKVVDGVIDYDARSEAQGDKNLWTEKSFGDFKLLIDWRLKEHAGLHDVPEILPDGSLRTDEKGKPITKPMPNADSGIYLRGTSKSQLNIWCWPIGSGEVWGYRNDKTMPPEVRAAAVPKVNADKPVGEWNTFEITLVGERLDVKLNGKTVIENLQLKDIPKEGPIALQHHGGVDKKTGELKGASSLVQFRNIYIKPLEGGAK